MALLLASITTSAGLFGESAPAPPAIPDPVFAPEAFYAPITLQWAIGLFILQLVMQILIAYSGTKYAAKAGLVAHQICVFFPFMYSSVRGTYLLFFDAEIAAMTAGTYTDRLYGFHQATWEMNYYFLGFQMYDLLATILEPSLRNPVHGMHHGLSLLTALAGLSGPKLQWYCPFFFGFVEVSSVPLGFVDLFRAVPPEEGSFLGTVSAQHE